MDGFARDDDEAAGFEQLGFLTDGELDRSVGHEEGLIPRVAMRTGAGSSGTLLVSYAKPAGSLGVGKDGDTGANHA